MEGNFILNQERERGFYISKKLLKDFITASELKILGLQRQGFYAFADGVYNDNSFQQQYGVVNVEGLEHGEYRSDIKHLPPSHSEIYKAANEGDDPFENDRHFIHKVATVSLDQWASQMVTVLETKGSLSCILFGCQFWDLFIKHYNFFPLFGGFGQKTAESRIWFLPAGFLSQLPLS
jgi:hypothetical protein